MQFDSYQATSRSTAQYPDVGDNIYYPIIGLGEEAGELLGQLKRIARDDGGALTDERRARIIAELGDVLWYAAAIAAELKVPLGEVARLNLAKLADRAERGVIKGEGDHR